MTAKSLKTQASNFSSERNAPQRFRFSACRPVLLLAALATLGVPLCHGAAGPKAAPRAAHVDRNFGKVPLSFEKNQGQADARVQFLSRGQGYALFLTPGKAVLELQKPSAAAAHANPFSAAPATQSATLGMKLLGGNLKAAVSGEDLLPGTVNYFAGSDQSKWKTALPTYQRVSYKAVYPGVDLVYYGNQRELEYDFVVAPGADAAEIALQFTGASPVVDKSGDLVLSVQGEDARFHKPVVYQLDGDRKISVEGSYQIADNKVGFALGAYDHSKPLVIDPVLSYLTYLGGTANDTITGMTVDSAGSVYVIGNTSSTDFPVKGAYQSTNPETLNPTYPLAIFVSKFNATGTTLVYSTYLGASEYTYSAGIAVDTGGNAYVTGYTSYGDYPVTAGAYQTICGANNVVPAGSSTGVRVNACIGNGQEDTGGVLTKLDPTGSKLVYSTYLSGGNATKLTAVAVNAAGEAWVTGVTNAVCPGPYNSNGTGYQSYFCIATSANASEPTNPNQSGDTYGIVVKFNAQGNGLLYSTTLGNHNPVGHYVSTLHATGIALDTAGNAYVSGYMDANFFITTTTGAFEPSRVANSLPAFVAKYNPAGTSATSQVYSTYLTGTTASNDIATGVAVDASGNAVVTGYTNSCTFPTTAGAFSTVPGGYVSQNICSGGFLSKLNATGSGLVWSTYTGNNGANGRNNDDNDAVALGSDGSVYVAGDEQGVVLSPTVNPVMVQSESHFAYIKRFKADGSAVAFSSAIGGTTDATSIPTSIFVDATNNIYLAGYTNSATYPTTPGAFQPHTASPGGGYINDSFVVKIAPTATTTTALTLPTGVVGGQSAKFTAKVTGQTGSTGTPTGTVTFLSGATTLGTGTLDGTGTASYTATSLNATTYSVTASYAGDTAFSASVSAAQNLMVAPATATVALTAPATALVGASVTLSVAVTGTPGTPTGSVTFKDGATTLSTATLASGTASFSTTSLAAGAHTITVSYSGDSIFGAATSPVSTVTINAAPAITFAAQPSSLTIVHGSSGTVVITGTPVGGYTGTVTFACGTLPAGASCTFAPSSLIFTANNTAASTTLTFSTVTTVAALESLPGLTTMTPVFAALLLLPLGFFSRRKLLRGGIVLSLLALVSMAALGGCSSGSKGPTTVTTAAGTYTVPVTVTAGTAVSTLNLSITVQ
ncbi:MAG TPA: Ig-like domain repeat protein [Acidobacteriaceae bacterium]|nr:Ig-like domain repeat protein [Acidobacteriaceae bacterium]